MESLGRITRNYQGDTRIIGSRDSTQTYGAVVNVKKYKPHTNQRDRVRTKEIPQNVGLGFF